MFLLNMRGSNLLSANKPEKREMLADEMTSRACRRPDNREKEDKVGVDLIILFPVIWYTFLSTDFEDRISWELLCDLHKSLERKVSKDLLVTDAHEKEKASVT